MSTYRCAFPSPNKQDKLDGYLRILRGEEEGDYFIREVTVDSTVYLTFDEWEEFTNNLLTSRAWLSGIVLVVQARAEGSVGIIVNCSGYNYARYVGFYADDKTHLLTNVPGLKSLTDPEVMMSKLNGVTLKDRILCDAVRS